MNTFSIPASDTVDLPRPKPEPEPEPEPTPTPSPKQEPQPNKEEAAGLVHQIREALVPQGDFVRIPAEAVLAHLPEEHRGPLWPGNEPTGTTLMLDRETLLQKLRTGTISYPLAEFVPDLLEGWVIDDPSAEVKLDLPTVVKAIPPELFGSVPGADAGSTQGPGDRDYFAPMQPAAAMPTPVAAPSARPEPMPRIQPPIQPLPRMKVPDEVPAPSGPSHLFGSGTGPKRQVVPTHIPGAWNGFEAACSASVGAVDLNEAGVDELQTLPGVGPERARMILENRTRRGSFDGIYDLLRIRGIGRKRFCRLTGLSLRRRDRRDRHEILNELIGLPGDSRPGLVEIARQISTALTDATCTLVAHDGVVLASSGPAESDSDLRAAIVPMLFRRTGRYLHSLAPGASDCVMLPLSDPPLLLFAVDRFFLMLEVTDSAGLEPIMPKAIAIARELTWLLGPRAIVRQPPTTCPGA
ncbi:MAG: helix-hairpin-helix domain-containing protein [Kiritimatiellae bacterium]|nr:helix-hairpin-helix domain-containing protein [Kiritimatiellia bacterium]